MSARLCCAVAVLLLAVGCGDNDEPAAGPPPETTSTASAFTVTDGVTTDELIDCLGDAGLDASFGSRGVLGLDVAVNTVDVRGLESYAGEPEQGATLYVFENPTAATENAGVVTLGGSDDPTNPRFGVHRNVVRAMYIIMPPPGTDDERALLGCLPG